MSVIVRYSSADKATSKVIAAEILTRVEQIYQFYKVQEAEFKSLNRINTSDNLDSHYWDIHFLSQSAQFDALPSGIYGLWPDELFYRPVWWLRSAMTPSKKQTFENCPTNNAKTLLIFDEEFDLDPFFMLFGIPADNVSRMRVIESIYLNMASENLSTRNLKNIKDVPF